MASQASMVESVEIFFKKLQKVLEIDDIPNNSKRALTSDNIRNKMSKEIRTAVDGLINSVEGIGYSTESRLLAISYCRKRNVRIRFAPTEKDNYGWLTAKLVTRKGTIFFTRKSWCLYWHW